MSQTSWTSRRNWISIKTPAVNVNYEIRPLHKTGAAACCLSGKGGAFRREEKTNKGQFDKSVDRTMLRYFVEKSDQSRKKVLKIQEKMDRYLGENVSFLDFSRK